MATADNTTSLTSHKSPFTLQSWFERVLTCSCLCSTRRAVSPRRDYSRARLNLPPPPESSNVNQHPLHEFTRAALQTASERITHVPSPLLDIIADYAMTPPCRGELHAIINSVPTIRDDGDIKCRMRPLHACINSRTGDVLVTDSHRYTHTAVHVFDRFLHYQRTWRLPGRSCPSAQCYGHATDLISGVSSSGLVQTFTSKGEMKTRFALGSQRFARRERFEVHSIAVGPLSNHIFAIQQRSFGDSTVAYVKEYASDGQFVKNIGASPLLHPSAITIAVSPINPSEEWLYGLDTLTCTVRVFDVKTAHLLFAFGHQNLISTIEVNNDAPLIPFDCLFDLTCCSAANRCYIINRTKRKIIIVTMFGQFIEEFYFDNATDSPSIQVCQLTGRLFVTDHSGVFVYN